MPKAIKHFSGTHNSGTGTIYTCPASTVAIIFPTLNLRTLYSSRNHSMSWNSSSDASETIYNINWRDVSNAQNYGLMSLGKYTNRMSWTTADEIYHRGDANGSDNAASLAYKSGPSSQYSTNIGGNNFDLVLGPMVMSAGHKLSFFTELGGNFSYSFLILEEEAG